jgi:hypothetical protein
MDDFIIITIIINNNALGPLSPRKSVRLNPVGIYIVSGVASGARRCAPRVPGD